MSLFWALVTLVIILTLVGVVGIILSLVVIFVIALIQGSYYALKYKTWTPEGKARYKRDHAL